MSTARIFAIIGITLLLTGCAPATGIKSILAIIAMFVSVCAAVWGMRNCREEDRAVRKGQELDQQLEKHARKYHESL